MPKDSETRLYRFILDKLKELDWDIRSPRNGGQVYAQNEHAYDPRLKESLGLDRPEYVVRLNNQEHWTIEAKSKINDIGTAITEAIEYADKINIHPELSCRIITGIAGSPDESYRVETRCFVADEWHILKINDRHSTGFISENQMISVLQSETGELFEYDITQDYFIQKTQNINKILHDGGVNKKNRAGVMACILLALAEDEKLAPSENPTTLIRDINTRAESALESHGKKEFFEQIKIGLPPSKENHEKHRKAYIKTIDQLRDINIASAIDSGMDVLGQFYEQFLRYANDAKELGIVFTPRHITQWAAEILDIKYDDIVFDPACGTGGFLVAALDKVKKSNRDKKFKPGNFYGIEQDPMIATLAIVNMIFRGDGSSKIMEGDSLDIQPDIQVDKVLMNPPFALDNEFEWKFVDTALKVMKEGGLLFAVLPTTTMASSNDNREELSWRKELLKRHTLKAVITMPEDLFYPQVSKGTYGVVIESHIPHNLSNDKVIWAILQDGETKTKTQSTTDNNMDKIAKAVGNYLATRTEPKLIEKEMDCRLLDLENLEFSPENHIGHYDLNTNFFNLSFVQENLADGISAIERVSKKGLPVSECAVFQLTDFFESIEKGKSGRGKTLPAGNFPLVSTSEYNNGISEFVDEGSIKAIYPPGTITISSNGGSCCAFYHTYNFAANPDVFVLKLKSRYNHINFGLFLCAAVNSEKWRYNYYRKFGRERLDRLEVKIPVNKDKEVDLERINQIITANEA